MKTLLILLLSTISLLSYSQTKEYYKHEGEIKPTTRSTNSITYQCKKVVDLAKINNINNKLWNKAPLKKDGSELTGDMLELVVVDDPEIFCKISAKVLKKYGFEIYPLNEKFETKIHDFLNAFNIKTSYDSSNGKVLEVEFVFFADEETYASYLPIEAYAEIESEIKKQVKATINEEGKTRIFCRQTERIVFKPKK